MKGNICEKRRVAYVGLPRTASRYIWSILKRCGFVTDRADQVHTHSIPEYTDGWTYMVSCRNPYQRAVSMYMISKNVWKKDWKDFEDFIKNYNFPGIYDSTKHLQNIKWIHFDTIHKDLADLCIMEPEPFIESEMSKNWKQYYTPELEQIVYERYEEDFIQCGYKREKIIFN